MKIAFFIDDYLPSVHGVATSTYMYKEALIALGHEVYIIAPKCGDYIDNDDHVIRMPAVKNIFFEKRPTASLYPGLAKKFDKYQFDIVHSQTQFYLGVLAHSVARRQQIPHVTTVHTLYTEMIDDYPFMITVGIIALTVALPIVLRMKPILPVPARDKDGRISREALRDILSHQGWRMTAAFANKCNACISPSKHLADILVQEGGLTVPHYILPNGINTQRYRDAKATDSPITKRPGDKFIVSVARLSPEKRQMTLVEAMPHIADQRVKLVLAGGGPSEQDLKQRVAELGLEDRVIFTGMLSSDEVAALLKQSDVFSLASYHFDNQPMTFLEAAAAGLPIVYCDERMTEGLTEANAILTDGIEGEDFAATFNALFADEKRLAALSKGALTVAKEFDSLAMAKRLVSLYQQLIDQADRPS